MNTSNNINYPINYKYKTLGPLIGSQSNITYSSTCDVFQPNNIIDYGTYKIRIYKREEILYICKFFTTKNKSSRMYKSDYYPTKLTDLYNMWRVYEICKLSYNIDRLLYGYTEYDEKTIKHNISQTPGQSVGQSIGLSGQVLGYSNSNLGYTTVELSSDIETIKIEI